MVGIRYSNIEPDQDTKPIRGPAASWCGRAGTSCGSVCLPWRSQGSSQDALRRRADRRPRCRGPVRRPKTDGKQLAVALEEKIEIHLARHFCGFVRDGGKPGMQSGQARSDVAAVAVGTIAQRTSPDGYLAVASGGGTFDAPEMLVRSMLSSQSTKLALSAEWVRSECAIASIADRIVWIEGNLGCVASARTGAIAPAHRRCLRSGCRPTTGA